MPQDLITLLHQNIPRDLITLQQHKTTHTTTHTTTMPFELGDLVYAKRCANGGYHQARIEMVIDNGRQYLVSWVNQVDKSDILVPRCHVMGYTMCHAVRHARATPNQNGGQDEADKAGG